MSQKQRLSHRLFHMLQIPADLAFGESMISCIGRHEMIIENFRKILKYQSTCICVLLKKGILQIEGEELIIVYYCQDEIKIKGFIRAVFFDS